MYYSLEDVVTKLGVDPVVNGVDGKPVYRLNSNLIMNKGLTTDEVFELISLHQQKLQIFDAMEKTNHPAKLKELAAQVTEIEFAMQKAWHFTQDANFHEWYRVPKCLCPKMDNVDARGTSFRVTTQNCPIHGWE